MAENPNRRSLGVFNTDEASLTNFDFTFSQTLTSNEPAVSLPETQSVTESVLAYREENGRTYHAYREGAYWFPNDAEEVERLRIMHEIIRRAMGDVNCLAPWTRTYYPRRVLDVATGTGDWCFDFAEEVPQAELIIGTDLSQIQPQETPPNVVFCIDDSSQEWLDTDLDYVHTRCTNGCWEDMYAQIIQQAFDKLNPGGWLECQEPDMNLCCDDGTMPPNHALQQWTEELLRLGHIAGKPIDNAPYIKGWLEHAGFVDVQERVFKVPTCAWPQERNQRELGWWMEEMLSSHVSGISRAYVSRVHGISVEEHEASLVPVRQALRNRDAHTYMRLHVVTGRKPGSAPDRFTIKIPEPGDGDAELSDDTMTAG